MLIIYFKIYVIPYPLSLLILALLVLEQATKGRL